MVYCLYNDKTFEKRDVNPNLVIPAKPFDFAQGHGLVEQAGIQAFK
jgi:hypothetical protein